MTPTFAAVDWGGDFVVPPVSELFQLPTIIDLGPYFSINRVVIITWFAVGFAMLLFGLAFSNARIVPTKLQAAAEAIVSFVRDQVATEIIGPEGRRYVPFLTTVFMFVWLNNLFEVIPFVNFPATSKIALPLFLALIVWVLFIVIGMKHQGPIGYLRSVAFPPGVPWPLYILLTPIEIVSTFILRPFTLMVRLFANMVAGHILLTIIFIAAHVFFYARPGLPIGIIAGLFAGPLLIGFEIFIGLLQAYIFILLTSVYIGGALHPEH